VDHAVDRVQAEAVLFGGSQVVAHPRSKKWVWTCWIVGFLKSWYDGWSLTADFVGDLKFRELLQECLFLGADFSIFGRFFLVLDNFDSFRGLIFPFWSFSQLRDTVYSQAEPSDDVLPIQKRLSSPAIGPPSLPVCPNCGFGTKLLISFGRIVVEHCLGLLTALVGPTSSTHHSSARGGGPRGFSPSFFPLFWVAKCLNSPPKS
jgi:hypothetical protein